MPTTTHLPEEQAEVQGSTVQLGTHGTRTKGRTGSSAPVSSPAQGVHRSKSRAYFRISQPLNRLEIQFIP